jgi:hypothetical protein
MGEGLTVGRFEGHVLQCAPGKWQARLTCHPPVARDFAGPLRDTLEEARRDLNAFGNTIRAFFESEGCNVTVYCPDCIPKGPSN